MKNRDQIGAWIVGIMILAILILALSCTPKSGLQYHQDLQSKMNYEQAIQRNTAYSLKNAKKALKQAKKQEKIQDKLAKEVKKRKAIWDEIARMKGN